MKSELDVNNNFPTPRSRGLSRVACGDAHGRTAPRPKRHFQINDEASADSAVAGPAVAVREARDARDHRRGAEIRGGAFQRRPGHSRVWNPTCQVSLSAGSPGLPLSCAVRTPARAPSRIWGYARGFDKMSRKLGGARGAGVPEAFDESKAEGAARGGVPA